LSLLSKLWQYLTSGAPPADDNPDEVPDPGQNTIQEMETRKEQEEKTVTLFKIKF
jgi:hypothetical protein